MPLESDPIDLLTDDDGDLVVGTDLQFSAGLAAVAQGIRRRILAFEGEWFLDLDHGVPYFQRLLGHKFDHATARQVFRTALVESPGVVELLSLLVEFSRGTRVLSVSWEVRTEFGDTADEITLEI